MSGLSDIVQSNAAAAASLPPPPFSMVTGDTPSNCSDLFDASDLAFNEERASLQWESTMDTSNKRHADDQDDGDDDLDDFGDTGPRPARQRTAEHGDKSLSIDEIHAAESLASSVAISVVVQSSVLVSTSQPSQPSSAPQATGVSAEANTTSTEASGLPSASAGSGGSRGGKPIQQHHQKQPKGRGAGGGRKRG